MFIFLREDLETKIGTRAQQSWVIAMFNANYNEDYDEKMMRMIITKMMRMRMTRMMMRWGSVATLEMGKGTTRSQMSSHSFHSVMLQFNACITMCYT